MKSSLKDTFVKNVKKQSLQTHFSEKCGYASKSLRTGMLIAAALSISVGLPHNAAATPINANVSISGSVEFDSTGSPSAPTSGATQSGNLTRIVGGTTTTTTLSGATISGSDPLTGTLTDFGDGFGVDFTANGSSTSGTSQISDLFGDLFLTLTNNSATDTFTVNLKLDFDGSTDANGADAFAQSHISLDNVTNTAELFFSDLESDTLNGDVKHVHPDGSTDLAAGNGDPLSNSGSIILSLILAPNAKINLGDNSFEVRARGGTFDSAGGSFSTFVSMLLTVESVVNQSQPPIPESVPEPEILVLLALGVVSLRLTTHRNPRFSAK